MAACSANVLKINFIQPKIFFSGCNVCLIPCGVDPMESKLISEPLNFDKFLTPMYFTTSTKKHDLACQQEFCSLLVNYIF